MNVSVRKEEGMSGRVREGVNYVREIRKGRRMRVNDWVILCVGVKVNRCVGVCGRVLQGMKETVCVFGEGGEIGDEGGSDGRAWLGRRGRAYLFNVGSVVVHSHVTH